MNELKKSLEITIPVYNEEVELAENILRLYEFAGQRLQKYRWQITIADNASFDRTAEIGRELSRKYSQIKYRRLDQKGRGRAIKKVWQNSHCDLLCYMDIDLSTDLKHLPALIAALENGADIAIGSRLLPGSKVLQRSFKRELISHSYNLLIKLFFQTRFSDAQCGFKAMRREIFQKLVPVLEDNGWFLDSEMLIIAEKSGLKIHEEAVVWRDNPGSTVRVLPTAMADFHGLWRLFTKRPWSYVKIRP